MTGLGPLQLNHGTPSHEALNLAAGCLLGDGPALWAWDGLPSEVVNLLIAQAKLSALLASALAERLTAEGGLISPAQVLQYVRSQQLAPGERSAP